MNRFFLNQKQIKGEEVHFTPAIAHQILHVLRLHEGDAVQVLDNQGHAHRVRLKLDRSGNLLHGRIEATQTVTSESAIKISLCFGLSNRDKVELILQKATEVGVSAFYPFISSRSLVQKAALSDKKHARWERIIREAAEQSGRGKLPELHPPRRLEECALAVKETHARMLIAWEKAETSQDQRLFSHLAGQVESLALFVGPEGGFSQEEIQNLQASGCEVVSLGARILRMETAAIIFPALVLYDLGVL